jgi:hypothetical protein
MKIRVSFLTDYNTICGMYEISLNNNFLTKQNIESMFDITTDLNNTFQETGKIHSLYILDRLQNIFGESANIILDLNISYYGDDGIEDHLLNDIGGNHRLIISINDDFFNFVDVVEEGSQNKVENIIQENGVIII